MLEGRPGPILLSLPEDVIDVELDPPIKAPLEPAPAASHLMDARCARIVRLLERAKRPAILAGGGLIASGARDQLVRLSEQLELPVFAAWRRPTAFPNDHPHYLGMTGYGAPASVRQRLTAADALLVIGCRLNEIASFDYAIPARRTQVGPRRPGAARRGLLVCSARTSRLPPTPDEFLAAASAWSATTLRRPRGSPALAAERGTFVAETTCPPMTTGAARASTRRTSWPRCRPFCRRTRS